MKRERTRFVVGVLIAVATLLEQLSAQATKTLPSCESSKVNYSAFDSRFADKIVLRKSGSDDVVPENAKKFSPQHTRWFSTKGPDFTKPGPWTTTLLISGRNSDASSLELSFVDHGNGGVAAEWMNEKLLFVRVWWGRIVSTDLILNVEEMSFPYREMANYGDFVQPCQ